MTLGTEHADITPFMHAGFEVKVQPTLLLDCGAPLTELWAGLRNKTRNVIRRARERLTVQCIEDALQFTRFYEENLEDDVSYFGAASAAAAGRLATASKARLSLRRAPTASPMLWFCFFGTIAKSTISILRAGRTPTPGRSAFFCGRGSSWLIHEVFGSTSMPGSPNSADTNF
jgi:hypothetical protein